MLDWSSHLTYIGIVVVLVLTGAGLPIPEEVPVIAAGVASFQGRMIPWLALISCLVGALLGDCLMYWIGRHFGRGILEKSRWFPRVVRPERERQIEQMIARHGWKVFLAARFLVGLRSPVYLTAGILRVPFRRFILIDALCATLVVGLVFGLSFYYAAHIETLWRWIHNSQYALTVLVVIGLLTGIGWYLWRRRQRDRNLPWLESHPEPMRAGPDHAEAARSDEVEEALSAPGGSGNRKSA